tara:strand:- start:410 stop:2875 length:2466 start_codon:yes stop_codon:yes gene_type:complete
MTRIKKASQAGVSYQGSTPGGRFLAIQPPNENRALKEWKAAREADARTIGRELSRKQKAETTALGLQQTSDRANQQLSQLGDKASLAQTQLFEKQQLQLNQLITRSNTALQGAGMQAQQSVEASNLKATGTAIQGLLSLSKSYLDFKGKQIETEYADLVNEQRTSALFPSDWLTETNDATDDQKDEINLSNKLQTVETQVVSKEATNLVDSDDPADIHAATTLKQGTIWNQTSAVRGNVFSARTLLPAALQEAITNGVIRPGPQGFEDAAAFLKEYARATGIINADERLVREHFIPTAENIVSTQLTALTKKNELDIQKGNQVDIDARISDLTDSATTADIGAIFDKAVLETINGNGTGQYGGINSTVATKETLEAVLDNLLLDGKTEIAESLRNHVANKSTGIKLGTQFDDIFDKKIKATRQEAVRLHTLRKGELQVAVENTKKTWYSDPTPENRTAYLNALKESGTKENLTTLNSLLQRPDYNPGLYTQLLENKSEGTWKSESFYKSLLDNGSITAEEFKSLSSETGLVGRSLTKARAYLKTFDIKERLLSANPSVSKSSQGVLQIETRARLLQTKLSDMIEAEIRADPKKAQDDTVFTDLIEEKIKLLQSEPIFTIDINTENLSIGAGKLLTADQARAVSLVTDKTGNQNFTQIKNVDDLFKTYPFSIMDASKDRFYTNEEFEQEIKHIATEKAFSKRTIDLAKKLYLNPHAFLEAQSSVIGTRSVTELVNEYRKANPTIETPEKVNYQEIGLTPESSNIFAKILGGDEVDLKTLEFSLKSVYPEAYSIFSNPNSTKADLRRGTYLYFGYQQLPNLNF